MSAAASRQIRILLISDYTLIRTGLKLVLECKAGIKVIGQANSSEAAMQLAAREQPDIILLDPDQANGYELGLIPRLLEAANGARVIVLSGQQDDELHRRAVRLGAKGLVLKDHSVEVLHKAVEKVYIGEVWLDRSMMANILTELSLGNRSKDQRSPYTEVDILTERELEVIDLICEGLQNKVIGTRLSISEPTVRHHLTSIFDKLGVTSRLELVIYAYQNGLAKLSRA